MRSDDFNASLGALTVLILQIQRRQMTRQSHTEMESEPRRSGLTQVTSV